MTDIVARLQLCIDLAADMYDEGEILAAIAEIKRLREQVASLQASSGYEASIAQVEIERLCADVELSNDRYVAAVTENERLRAALHSLQGCNIDNRAQDIIIAALEAKP